MKSDKPKRTKRLPVKQDKFVQEYVSNKGNGTAAVLASYDTTDKKSASVIAVENLGKLSVQNELARLMKASDLTPKRTLGVISAAMSAETAKGLPNHSTRLRAADMSAKLNGLYPNKNQTFSHKHAHLHLVEALAELPAEEIDAELAKLEE